MSSEKISKLEREVEGLKEENKLLKIENLGFKTKLEEVGSRLKRLEDACVSFGVLSQPVEQPKPVVVESKSSKWRMQLSALHSMGYNDDVKNIMLLEWHGGDVTKVVNVYMGESRVEEPVKLPVKLQVPVKVTADPFAGKVKILVEMGYSNEVENRRLLEKHNGDIQSVVKRGPSNDGQQEPQQPQPQPQEPDDKNVDVFSNFPTPLSKEMKLKIKTLCDMGFTDLEKNHSLLLKYNDVQVVVKVYLGMVVDEPTPVKKPVVPDQIVDRPPTVVQPKPQPKPQPTPVVVQDKPNPNEQKLRMIREMGFLDDQVSLDLLKKYNGDVQQCIKDLLMGPPAPVREPVVVKKPEEPEPIVVMAKTPKEPIATTTTTTTTTTTATKMYENELGVLHSMGFNDDVKNVEMLKKFNGDCHRCVQEFMGMGF